MSVDTLWYTRCPVPTAFSIAVQLGWIDDEFRRDGIVIQSLRQSSDKTVHNSHFAHTQPASFRHGGNIPPLWARSVGADVKLIALSWTNEFQAVLTLPGSGIRTVDDLRGKRLSLPRRKNDSIDFWRATALRGYQTALATAGLDLRDVKLVEVGIDRKFLDDGAPSESHDGSLWGARTTSNLQREEALALARGEVDALFTHGGWGVHLASFLGAHVVIDNGRLPDRRNRINNCTPLALTASGKLIEERPDLVARWLARVLEAADWARTHRDDARRIIADEVGVAEEWIPVTYGTDFNESLTPDLSSENVAALASQKALLLEHGFLANDVDLNEFVDPRPLAEAESIVRGTHGARPAEREAALHA